MSPGAGWMDAAKSRPVVDVAADLGIYVHKGRIGCPACGEDREKGARRAAAGVSRKGGWTCNSCKVYGSVIDLVAWKLVGKPYGPDLTSEDRLRVKLWWGQGPALPAGPRVLPPPDYPPVDALRAFWSSLRAIPPQGVTGAYEPPRSPPEPDLAAFWDEWKASGRAAFWEPAESGVAACWRWLRSREIDPSTVARMDLVRAAPMARPSRLPEGEREVRGYGWPYCGVLPLYDATGLQRSALFRAVVDPGLDWEGNPRKKSYALAGYARSGLVMADPVALAILRRSGVEPGSADMGRPSPVAWNGDVCIVEGEPDFLTLATYWDRFIAGDDGEEDQTYAVIGCPGSGSFPPEVAARFPSDAEVRIYQHPDEAGRKLTAAIRAALPAGMAVEVIDLPAGADLNDVAMGKLYPGVQA